MSVLRVTLEHKKDLKALLNPSAEYWIGRSNVFSLAEFGAFGQFEGLIQFTVRDEEIPAGELLYLYVRPECRHSGTAEQLLMAMEECFFQSGINRVEVLLTENSSGLGEYLEDYGFEMEETDTRIFTFPYFPAENDAVRSAKKKIVSLADLTGREREELEPLLKEACRIYGGKQPDERQTCVYRDPARGTGIILAEKREGRPTIFGMKIIGKDALRISTLLSLCMISEIQKYSPRGVELAVSDRETAQLLEKKLDRYIHVEKAVKGMLSVREPQRLDDILDMEETYGRKDYQNGQISSV